MRSQDQARAVEEVVSRVTQRVNEGGGRALEAAIADTLYHESQRLAKGKPSKTRARELAAWDGWRARLLEGSDDQRRQVLREVVEAFTREVLGNFDPTIHTFATRAVPMGLAALLHATSPRQILRRFPDLGIEDRVVVEGEVELAQALQSQGTLVFVPTHSSNLDSIVLGYGMHEAGFPPLLYGAGLNLFENRLVGFFMHNLGAYKVDRRKTAPLYREVLKEYATVSLEYGYDNLFFPGGTRCRSGEVEQHLKLGLLGTSLSAFQNNLMAGRPKPGVFVIPVVLSYELVLEAETLIDDHLREVGRSRYIITDDEFASPRRIYQFLRGILDLDATIHITVMPAMDVFGNPVDREGRSLDPRGRPIDVARYLQDATGAPVRDAPRDREYVRRLGEKIAASYLRGNTLYATHVAAWALFEALRAEDREVDLYRFLRSGGRAESLPWGRAVDAVATLRERLAEKLRAGELQLDGRVARASGEQILESALTSFRAYHTRPALERVGDRVFAPDRNLLYYYRNRLVGYGLETA